jgi:glucosylceramidase
MPSRLDDYIIESSQLPGVVDSVAFLNPDGSKGLIVLNERMEATRVTLRWNGSALTYELPAQAVATFTWQSARVNASWKV